MLMFIQGINLLFFLTKSASYLFLIMLRKLACIFYLAGDRFELSSTFFETIEGLIADIDDYLLLPMYRDVTLDGLLEPFSDYSYWI